MKTNFCSICDLTFKHIFPKKKYILDINFIHDFCLLLYYYYLPVENSHATSTFHISKTTVPKPANETKQMICCYRIVTYST